MSYTESFYAILGVDRDASQQEIKQAYKKAALRTHPDRARPERKAEAERDFKKIAEAYETLSEPSSRNRYNHYGTSNSPPPYKSHRQQTSPNNPNNTFFGVSPDKQPYSFQWESSYDSARRAQAQRGPSGSNRRPFGGVDPFQLFNEMFERDFSSSMGGGRFGEDPTFANHQRMADTNGFGFGTAFGSGAAFGFGGGMPLMGADIDDSPFASHGSNDMAATRRGAPGFGNDGMMGTMSSAFGSFSSSSMSNSTMGGKFSSQSESRNTRTVNGRTETVIRKVDGQGNETLHTITPEGQQVHVNGVEQPGHPLLQQGQGSTPAAALPGPTSRWPY